MLKVKIIHDKMIKCLNFLISLKFTLIFLLVLIGFSLSTLWYFSIGLPDYKKLSNYQPLFQAGFIHKTEN